MSNFVNRVFDFSFKEFITPSLIKILFILCLIGIGIGYLVSVVGAFWQGFGSGLLTLILGAVFAAIAVIIARVYLELVNVAFRAVSLLEVIAGEKATPAAPPSPPEA